MNPEGIPNDQAEGRLDIERLISELTPALTTMRGYAQLIRRRIHRGIIDDPDVLLTYLAHIEGASRIMETSLRKFEIERYEELQ